MADLGWPPSEEVNRSLAEKSEGRAILSFSAGKDSLGAWLAMRAAGFTRILPVYMYLVPDLEFVEQGLRYYEDYFETRVIRLPHPSLHRWLNNGMAQTFDHMDVIVEADLPMHDYDALFNAVRIDNEVGLDCFTAMGVRASDSPNRHSDIKQWGPVNHKRRTWFPIYDWTADRLRAELRAVNLKLPADYRLFGRSFDGLDVRFLAPIATHYPNDFERIREWFPLIDVFLMRHRFFWPAALQGILDSVVTDDGVKVGKAQAGRVGRSGSRGSVPLVGRKR